MSIKLYEGDCLNYLPEIPSKSIDLILADLPYGTTANSWDKIIPMEPLWEQYKRIIKDHGAILLFGQEPFSSHLRLSAPKQVKFRYDWIYEKANPVGFFHANQMPLRAHEVVSVFYKHLPTYNPQFTKGKPYVSIRQGLTNNYLNTKRTPTVNLTGKRYPRDVLHINNCDRTKIYHPTQKPLELIKYMVKTYTNEGDLVLDNVMGSGQTGVACQELRRNFIGMEKEHKYFEIAKNRIESVGKEVA